MGLQEKCEEPGCLNWATARVTVRAEVKLLCDVHLTRLTRIAAGRGVAVEDNRKPPEIVHNQQMGETPCAPPHCA